MPCKTAQACNCRLSVEVGQFSPTPASARRSEYPSAVFGGFGRICQHSLRKCQPRGLRLVEAATSRGKSCAYCAHLRPCTNNLAGISKHIFHKVIGRPVDGIKHRQKGMIGMYGWCAEKQAGALNPGTVGMITHAVEHDSCRRLRV